MASRTDKSTDARARAAARREQIRKQEQRRKLGLYGLGGGVAVIVVVLVVLFLVVFPNGTKNATKDINAPVSATLAKDLSSIPESAFATVGTTGVGQTVGGLTAITDTPITTDGKPTFVYVGGEFCPFCAAERWTMVAALSRFGTFSGLETTRSAANDGNYATLSFVNASYTSPYLVLDAKEILDRARNKLQTLDAAASTTYAKYGGGGVPYISVNNQFHTTYQYDPSTLGSMTSDEIGAAILDTGTSVSKQVLASANVLSAAICATTEQQPASVCGTTEVKAAAAALTTGSSGSGSSGG